MRKLEIRGLTKRYPRVLELWKVLRHPLRREEVEALRGVDLVLETGHLYGLVGPNGAGKTTLLKLLGGLVLPTQGSILLDGQEVTGAHAVLRKRARMVVADERSFFWRLSVRENLRFFATLEGRRGAERDRVVARCLAEVSLSDRADETFRSLSTGMRQRLAIARGLLGEPEVLLLDEATRSLDPESAAEVRALVSGLCRREVGRTVVWSSHDLDEVENLCTDVVVLSGGRVIEQRLVEPLAMVGRWRIRTRRPVPVEPPPSIAGVELRRIGADELVVRASGEEALEAFLAWLRASGAGILALAPLRLDAGELFATEDETRA